MKIINNTFFSTPLPIQPAEKLRSVAVTPILKVATTPGVKNPGPVHDLRLAYFELSANFLQASNSPIDRQGRASQETHQYVGLRTCRTCLDWPSTILPQLLKLHAEPACSDTVWEPFRHNQWTIFRVLPFSAHLNISRVFRNTLIMQVELGERNPNQRSINRLQYGHPPNYPVFQNPPVIPSVCRCERTLNPQNA